MLIAAVLVAGPLTQAHDGGTGQPKSWCESYGWDTPRHEYATGTGFLLLDSRLAMPHWWDDWDIEEPLLVHLPGDGSVPPCPYGDTTWDGHDEFAIGGAWLQAAQSPCTEAYADHTPGTLILVSDAVLTPLGSDVAFSVYADTLNNDPVPSEPNCGDFESDYGIDCVNQCAPGFPPGLDGTYQVYVSGFNGHIYAEGAYECMDGADNDGDGNADYPTDLGCLSPTDDTEAPNLGVEACNDLFDNDGDGFTDFPADPGCDGPNDNSESPNPPCSDGIDNDGDGQMDYPADPGCTNSRDGTESSDPACSDGLDNDGDGRTDYPADPECGSRYAVSEGPCANGDALQAPEEGTVLQGGATVSLTVGSGRTLGPETVYQSGGPSPNPNVITHTTHTGTGQGSHHEWTVGGSSDTSTRQFTYRFSTDGCAGAVTYTGTFYVYN